MNLGTAFVQVRPDTKQFSSELTGDVEDAGRSAAQKLRDVFSAALFARGLKGAIDAASNLEQAVGGTAAVFGQASGAVDDFASRSAEALGLSEREFREFTSQIGGQLKAFGFDAAEAADRSIELTQLGADLAATYGGPVSEAVSAVSAALRGEFDPLERYGTALRATDIAARAVALGLAESTGEVDNQAKAQATLSLLLEQTASAQGQFARESDTAAGASAIAAAQAEDAAASLGENFLPIYQRIVQVVGAVADAFGSLPGFVQVGIVALAGVAALSGPFRTIAEFGRSVLPLISRGFDRAAISAYNFAGAINLGTVAGAGAILTALAAAYIGVKMRSDEAKRAAEEYAEALDQQGDAAEEALSALIAENLAGVISRQDELGISTEEATAAITGQADAVEALAAERERLNEVLARDPGNREAQDRLAAIDAIAREAAAYQRATAETEANTGAQDEVQDALAGTGEQAGLTADEIDAISDALDRLLGASLDLPQAQRDLAAAFDEAFASIIENGVTAFDDLSEAGRANRDALDEVVESTTALVQAQLDAGEGGVAIQSTLDATIGRLQAARDAGLISAEAFQFYAGIIRDVPTAVETDVQVPGLLTSQERVRIYDSILDNLPPEVRTRFSSNVNQARSEVEAYIRALDRTETIRFTQVVTRFDPPRAEGGPVRRGGIHLVGEEGPEFVRFDRDGFVTPADLTRAAMEGAAAGGSTTPIRAAGGYPSADEIGRAVARALAQDPRALYLAIAAAGRPVERGQRQATERVL